MVYSLADDGRMAEVQVSFLHLLKLVGEDVVHQCWNLEGAAGLAVLLISLQLVQPSSDIQNELRDELLATSADIAFHIDQKLTKNVINTSRIGLILMWLIFLLMLLPIILNPLQKCQIFLGQILTLLITILLFLSKREEFIQIPLQLLHIVAVFNLLHGFYIVIVLYIHTLVLVLTVQGQFGELRLSVVLGLHMGVKCGVAEV